ncbi:MAG: trypsin-like serine protease [Deltaproteobacteria bacterium]|nr:trypsin-like serine protease [Deltaproteobacteria bacterium]
MRPFFLTFTLMLLASTAEARVYESFADVAERAIPGVVNIRTTIYSGNKDPALDLYQFFLNGTLPRSAQTHSVGSGVVIDNQGHILTNHHVVENASVIEVLFAKTKRKVNATIVGIDPKTDLALLRTQLPPGVNWLDPGDSDLLRVGDVVLAIGNPFGYAHTVTSGIISAKGRVIGAGPYDDFLQTDAAIHPGNSGGPLIDIRGRVIGINTAVAAEGPNIGFAIPINIARAVVRDLLKFGKVKRPYIGIVGKNILSTDEVESGDTLGGVYGVIITNLIVEGPGYNAGLKIGDLVMAIDNEKVLDMNQLQRMMSTRSPSDHIRLKIYRRGRGFMHVNLGLEEFPRASDLPVSKDLF